MSLLSSSYVCLLSICPVCILVTCQCDLSFRVLKELVKWEQIFTQKVLDFILNSSLTGQMSHFKQQSVVFFKFKAIRYIHSLIDNNKKTCPQNATKGALLHTNVEICTFLLPILLRITLKPSLKVNFFLFPPACSPFS